MKWGIELGPINKITFVAMSDHIDLSFLGMGSDAFDKEYHKNCGTSC